MSGEGHLVEKHFHEAGNFRGDASPPDFTCIYATAYESTYITYY